MTLTQENRPTKLRIADEALNLFSVSGFGTVSVRDIAKAVGIKESSLYNHYKNKRDIFDTIVEDCLGTIDAFFGSMNLRPDIDSPDNYFINRFATMEDKEFLELSLKVVGFYFTDDRLVKFRKMLTIEQYKDDEIRDLFRGIFINNTLEFQASLFSRLMELGLLKKDNPHEMALQFYSPVFLLYFKYDEFSAEAADFLSAHILKFRNTYKIDNNKGRHN